MSVTTVQEVPISFDQYIEQKRAEFEKFVRPYFEHFEAEMAKKNTSCDFYECFETNSPFPWGLVASELTERYPQYKPLVFLLQYDPGESELHIEGYTVRFLASVGEC